MRTGFNKSASFDMHDLFSGMRNHNINDIFSLIPIGKNLNKNAIFL
jgi:hypothetical protein